jgi:hypothetical protein
MANGVMFATPYSLSFKNMKLKVCFERKSLDQSQWEILIRVYDIKNVKETLNYFGQM